MTTDATSTAATDSSTSARMVIGGETVEAADGQTFDIVNPATGRTIATAPLGGHEDVERAVGSSVEHSFPSDYRRALQALNKGTPVTVDNHNELAGSFSKFARALAGIEKAPAGTKKPAARFSLFGTRKGKGSTEESTS